MLVIKLILLQFCRTSSLIGLKSSVILLSEKKMLMIFHTSDQLSSNSRARDLT